MNAPPLEGTYRLEREGSREPDVDWVAFRDACTAEGCIATSAYLNPLNLRAPAEEPRARVWHWMGESWQVNINSTTICSGPDGSSTEKRAATLSLTSIGDGNYRLATNSTIVSDECANEGTTYASTSTLTRTGPAPVGVVADPPASLIGRQPEPLLRPSKPPTPIAVDVAVDGRPVAAGTPVCIWSDTGDLDVLVKGPDGKIFMSVSDISAPGARWADITIDGAMFTDTSGRSLVVAQTGRTSFSVSGVVTDVLTRSSRKFEMDVTC